MPSNTNDGDELPPIFGMLYEGEELRRSAVEALLLADDDLFDSVDMAETEALDRCARRELVAHELGRIERRATGLPALARRIAFSRALAEKADEPCFVEERRPC